MRRVIRDFSEMTRDADMAVVFFAGHGIEVDGSNFLIPTDAKLERDIDIEDEAIALDRVVRMLEPAKKLRLVILDACRDNPFARTMKRTMVSRSVGRGLAKVEPPTSDTLIAFAAKAGSLAGDGDGIHSPFTAALLKHIATPGLDLRIVFGRVRDEVIKNTSNRQEPFVYGSLGGSNVALVPGAAAPPVVVAALPAAPAVAVAPPPGRQHGVARLRARRADQHPGDLGRVPRDSSDRLLRQPCPRPACQAGHDGTSSARRRTAGAACGAGRDAGVPDTRGPGDHARDAACGQAEAGGQEEGQGTQARRPGRARRRCSRRIRSELRHHPSRDPRRAQRGLR